MNKTPDIKKRTASAFFMTLAASIFAVALVLSALMSPAEARRGYGFQKSPAETVERLTDRLGLTEKQAEAIRPIIEDKARRMKEIRDSFGADRRASRTDMQKLRWDTEIKLNEVLTDEQVRKYLELRRENRGWFPGSKLRGRGPGKGLNRTPEQVIERLTSRLGLTGEQAEKMKPVIREGLEKKRAIFEKYGGKRIEIRQAMRDEMTAAGDETHKQLSNILTDEQIKEFDRLKEERRARRDRWMGPKGY